MCASKKKISAQGTYTSIYTENGVRSTPARNFERGVSPRKTTYGNANIVGIVMSRKSCYDILIAPAEVEQS